MNDHRNDDDGDSAGCPYAVQVAGQEAYGRVSRQMDFFLMGLIGTLVETLDARGVVSKSEFNAMLQESINRTPIGDRFGKVLKESFLQAGIADLKPRSGLN